MKRILSLVSLFLATIFLLTTPLLAQQKQPTPEDLSGVGNVHMETSCLPSLSADFDVALALLHNFWYQRAYESFDKIIQADPQCAMAYWGAAMTLNHPFWDAPNPAALTQAWGLLQQGVQATEKTPREQMYLDALTALYDQQTKELKADRDYAYRDAMKAVYEQYPDDETKLFYGLSIIGALKEGSEDYLESQKTAAQLFEGVYAQSPDHPGVLHYLIHVDDDPMHAPQGLAAARAYALAAPAVPHAQHMPSHIFTRLGYWQESASTNENAWRSSEADVRRSGESGDNRDFHALNYLQYAYLQLGRYEDAKQALEIIKAEYDAEPNQRTADDTPLLESRHVRGRTIYALPDRVAYGYFDMLTRYIIETGDWQAVQTIPLVAPSRDFVAMKSQLEVMVAVKRGEVETARTEAAKVTALSNEPDQHPFAQQILRLQAAESEALAQQVAGNVEAAIAKMDEAIELEDAIYTLSQPPYPIIPTHELYGTILMAMNRPAEAMKHFATALERTPNRPKAIYGIGAAAEAMGNQQMAIERYTEFLELWKNADRNLPELVHAKQFLSTQSTPSN